MSEWIMVMDGLPDHMDDVLVTIQINRRAPKVRSGCYIQLEDRGLFALDNGDTWNSTDQEVVAWMHSPAPCRRKINQDEEKFCKTCKHSDNGMANPMKQRCEDCTYDGRLPGNTLWEGADEC